MIPQMLLCLHVSLEVAMARTLIFLFDGTGNEPTDDAERPPTNVFKLNPLIKESKYSQGKMKSQVSFYFPGIATKFTIQSLWGAFKQVVYGDQLDEMVMRAYVNLSSNFRETDSIAIVGFSRGAIAARVFVRLIVDFGLLKVRSIVLLGEQMAAFLRAIECNAQEYAAQAQSFRSAYSAQIHADTKVEFLGLFDCAGGDKDLIGNNFFNNIDPRLSQSVNNYLHIMSLHDIRREFVHRRLRADKPNKREVWMPGVHSDVGGGYTNDLLSDISLFTMATEMQKVAGIALEKYELSLLSDKIRTGLGAVAAGPLGSGIRINKEPLVREKEVRKVHEGDRIHYIHRWMDNKTVNWKGEGSEIYRDRFHDLTSLDRKTVTTFRGVVPN
jgi:uncharacterized protein (DUF2235 family)